MKKILILLIAFMLSFGTMHAQVEPAKFLDNVSLSVKGGVTTPLNSFDKLSYEQVGLEIEKGITPWLSVAVDGNAFMGNKQWNLHTAFDKVNVNGLVKFNLFNFLGTFEGYRRNFEMSPFTGLGWSHYSCSNMAYHRNYMTYKAGMDFDFNLGESKAWAIRIQPAVAWDCSNNGKLNKNSAEFEINAGVVYHLKNHDGNRTFTMVDRYNQSEIDALNDIVNILRIANWKLIEENDSLKNSLCDVVEVISIINENDTIAIIPQVQFAYNSAELIPEVEGNVLKIAEYMKANPEKQFTIIGYASMEGNTEYNMVLSENRAKALRNKLMEYGVNSNQVLVKGAGATEKFSNNNRTLNRVVIVEENPQ